MISIPRSVAELVGLVEGTPMGLSVVGRQIVLEPTDDRAPEPTFRRALGAVLRRYGGTFEALAEYDSGKRKKLKK